MLFCEYVDEIPCLSNDYNKFDSICSREFSSLITVDEIVNHSNFCISIPIDLTYEFQDEFPNVNEHLSGLGGKVGLYHLWVDYNYCQDHKTYSMMCVYVGKGIALNRIKDHIKTKWPGKEMFHVSFFECENRISKYLEQLFLDTYKFYLNTSENTGSGTLYARWSEERYDMGTETQNLANIFARKNPEFS